MAVLSPQDSGHDPSTGGFQNTIAYYVHVDPLAEPTASHVDSLMSLIPDRGHLTLRLDPFTLPHAPAAAEATDVSLWVAHTSLVQALWQTY